MREALYLKDSIETSSVRGDQYLLDGSWDFKGVKPIRRKGIVFSAFVHNADKPMGFSFLVRYDSVQFANLERGLVTIVVQANRKMR